MSTSPKLGYLYFMYFILFHSAWVKPRRRLDYYEDDEEEDDELSEWVSIFIMRDGVVSFAAIIRVVMVTL